MNEHDDANVVEPPAIRVVTREEFDAAVGELFRSGRPIEAPSLKALTDGGGHTQEHPYDRPRTVCALRGDDGVWWNTTLKRFAYL